MIAIVWGFLVLLIFWSIRLLFRNNIPPNNNTSIGSGFGFEGSVEQFSPARPNLNWGNHLDDNCFAKEATDAAEGDGE